MENHELQDTHTQRSVSPLSHTSSRWSERSQDRERIYVHRQLDTESGTVRSYQPKLGRPKDNDKLEPSIEGTERTRAIHHWSRLETDWWMKELGALLLSFSSLLCIVLILRIHEGRPLPDWPLSITINSLVSIFSTIMGMTLVVPLAEGISQAKWHWFQHYHPLSDMGVYDRGSRGPWGALEMLWVFRLRPMSSLGALLTVLALAINPFAQQVATYQLEQVASFQNSTLPVRFSYPNDLVSSFKAAAYNGLFGSRHNSLTPYCPSGNCSWAPYQTLAVCSQCVNVTGLIEYTQSNHRVPGCDLDDHESSCLWSLPNGLALNNGAALNTSGTLPPIMLDKVGHSLVNFSMLGYDQKQDPVATECSLYWCVNTYTAIVNNTIFTEQFSSSWYNATSTLPLADIPSAEDLFNLMDTGSGAIELYNITPPTGGGKVQPNVNLSNDEMEFDSFEIVRLENYLVSNTLGVLAWLGPLLSGNVTENFGPSTDAMDLFYEGYAGASAFGVAFSAVTITVVQDTFDRLAQSLTTWIRTSQKSSVDLGMGEAVGIIWRSETVVKVRWAWLSLPCVLLAGTSVFLVSTIMGTTKKQLGIWKSSSLALLFHGLGKESGEISDDLGHLVGMGTTAEKTWVRLVDEGHGARLVER